MPDVDTTLTSCPIEHCLEGAEALQRLLEGNARFARGEPASRLDPATTLGLRARLVNGQRPFATIVSCSDSRVPSELVFDQGLGDLFIVRNAGSTIGVAPLASVEYAVTQLATPLVLVLAHERCGAIEAAYDATLHGAVPPSPSLAGIISRLAPSIHAVGPHGSRRERCERAARENVRLVAAEIASSPLIAPRVAAGRLLVTAGYYRLAEGTVELLDDAAVALAAAAAAAHEAA